MFFFFFYNVDWPANWLYNAENCLAKPPTAVSTLILRVLKYNHCSPPFVFNKIFRFEFVAAVGDSRTAIKSVHRAASEYRYRKRYLATNRPNPRRVILWDYSNNTVQQYDGTADFWFFVLHGFSITIIRWNVRVFNNTQSKREPLLPPLEIRSIVEK